MLHGTPVRNFYIRSLEPGPGLAARILQALLHLVPVLFEDASLVFDFVLDYGFFVIPKNST